MTRFLPGIDVLLEQGDEHRVPVDTIVALSLDSPASVIALIKTAK